MSDAGKGDSPRRVDVEKYNSNFDNIFRKPVDSGLSIIITLLNRSEFSFEGEQYTPLANNLDSIFRYMVDIPFEINIIDYGSTDTNFKFLEKYHPKVNLVKIKGRKWNLGEARNIGFENSYYDNLFFLDADMLIGESAFFDKCLERLGEAKAVFPICYNILFEKEISKKPRQTAYGNSFVTKGMFESVKGFEDNKKWGGEDKKFFLKLRNKYQATRPVFKSFLHQWHPLEFCSQNYESHPKN